MEDLIFHGGLAGAVFGNQQFTSRNLSFNGAVTAINQIWDWGEYSLATEMFKESKKAL